MHSAMTFNNPGLINRIDDELVGNLPVNVRDALEYTKVCVLRGLAVPPDVQSVVLRHLSFKQDRYGA